MTTEKSPTSKRSSWSLYLQVSRTMAEAVAILRDKAITYEFPGYIAVSVGDDKLAIGDANGYFGAQLNCVDLKTFCIPLSVKPETLADAITCLVALAPALIEDAHAIGPETKVTKLT